MPQEPFPAALDHTFTPPVTVEKATPDPMRALLDDEDEETDPDYPGIPFFPNNLTQPTFFPLMIGEEGRKEVAKYIYYRKHYQECVGTMGKGQPSYVTQVFLRTVYSNRLPQTVTDNQIDLFHPHDP